MRASVYISGLAWFKGTAITRWRKKKWKKVTTVKRHIVLRKIKIKVRARGAQLMDWSHKMFVPVRRVWLAVAARVKSHNSGAGLLKLHNDVQTCGYEDVQVMWEMLQRLESTELTASPQKPKPRSFWRVLIWSAPTAGRSS